MPQLLLPLFPSDATQIKELVSFAELWEQIIACQTYRKGVIEAWPAEEFQDCEWTATCGEKQTMKLAERGV